MYYIYTNKKMYLSMIYITEIITLILIRQGYINKSKSNIYLLIHEKFDSFLNTILGKLNFHILQIPPYILFRMRQ